MLCSIFNCHTGPTCFSYKETSSMPFHSVNYQQVAALAAGSAPPSERRDQPTMQRLSMPPLWPTGAMQRKGSSQTLKCWRLLTSFVSELRFTSPGRPGPRRPFDSDGCGARTSPTVHRRLWEPGSPMWSAWLLASEDLCTIRVKRPSIIFTDLF